MKTFRGLQFVLAIALLPPAAALADSGPSSSATPYLVPAAPGVEFTSVLTAGDTVKKKHQGNATYRMVGIPDGLGAFDNGDGTITVLMNHELGATSGVVRAHGAKGAFVSKWQIRKSDLKVLNGEDANSVVKLWTGGEYVDTPGVVFNRFCSADLASKSAFFDAESGLGFNEGYVYLNGEEAGAGGRAFAHVIQGVGNSAIHELPSLGRMSWENAVASPTPQDATIVAGLDDSTPGNVYFYVGEKRLTGNPIELAGLQGGSLHVIDLAGLAAEPPLGFTSARFALRDVENPGSAGADPDGTNFNRPEDGAWDPRPDHGNLFYFVTTASFTGNSRLWRVTFDDVRDPLAGGVIEVLVDGSLEGPKMMDNLAVDLGGRVIIQEDPGNQAYLARIWAYDPASDSLQLLAQHDPARFAPGASDFTADEESSGVIEVTPLFTGVDGYDTAANRYYLLDVQAHTPAGDLEIVERGQLLLMRVPN